MNDFLSAAFPLLGQRLQKLELAELPTPVEQMKIVTSRGSRKVLVKRDDISGTTYGGNKIRKLEYILRRALDRKARRVATFGAAGSNHALATAVLARQVGLECTCFLTHQKRTPKVARTLNMHRSLGTEIVRYGGTIEPLPLFRHYLQNRRSWVIPLGGSSWLGTVGFVNAGLELAHQVQEGQIPCPDRVYIATGTMGSTAGLALGLAAAGLPAEIHAVCVVDEPFGSPEMLNRLMQKTSMMLNRIDPSFDARTVDRVRLTWRSGFLAGGYAQFDDITSDAVDTASRKMDLGLETTYTGKAMAAMLSDLQHPNYDGGLYLFWNTHNSRDLPVTGEKPDALDNIPEDFLRYYD